MDEKSVFDQINSLLEEGDYPLEIRSVADLTDFLNDQSNRRFEQFAEIGRLYDQLVGKPEFDRNKGI